jgi:chloride channel 3/4/5
MVGAVTLQIINPFRTNQLVLFQVTYDRPWHAFEIIWFVIIGAFGGMFGAVFIRYNLMLNRFRKASLFIKKWAIVEVSLIAVASACIGYFSRFSRVSMSELVANLFRECSNTNADPFGLCE